MWEAGDLLAEHFAIGVDVRRSDLEQIVELPGYHVAFFDLADATHAFVELGQCGLARIAQFDLGKRDVALTKQLLVNYCAKAADIAVVNQFLEPQLARRLGQSNPVGEFCDCHAAIDAQFLEDAAIEAVKLAKWKALCGHYEGFMRLIRVKSYGIRIILGGFVESLGVVRISCPS